MLQRIRDNAHGWWVYVVVPLLILVFALFGISNYLTGSMSQADIAKVNGDSISYVDFATVYQQLNQQQNPSQNKMLSHYLQLQVLQNLINQQLLFQGLSDLGFAVNPEIINEMIYQTPAFQDQGRFSMQKYQMILQNLGLTTEALRNSLTKAYLIQQMQAGLMSSQFALSSEVDQETMLANGVRDVNYVTIDPANFTKNVQVSDSEIAAYYQAHSQQFMTPYQVQLQYITLSLDQFSHQFKDPNQAQAAFQNAVNSLSNVSFQNPDSLTPAANMLKVPVQMTGWLSSNSNTGLFANPQVLAAALSDSVLNGGNNSSVINLGKNQVMVLRVLNKKMPTPLSLQQVAPQIKNFLVMQQAIASAQAEAKMLEASINKGASFNVAAANMRLPVQNVKAINRTSKGLDANLLGAFNRAEVGGVMIVPSDNKLIVFQVANIYVSKNLAVKVPPQAILNVWSQIEMSSFLAHLQASAKVKTNDALLRAQ